jgi:hypothetical protein
LHLIAASHTLCQVLQLCVLSCLQEV